MPINKILHVAVREYLETVKTKAFVISLLLVPLFMGVFMFISTRLQEKAFSGPRPDRNVAVFNLEDSLAAPLDSAFAQNNTWNPQRKIVPRFYGAGAESPDKILAGLKERVVEGQCDALLVVEKGVIEGNSGARFFSRSAADIELYPTVRGILNRAVGNSRFLSHGISPALIAELQHGINLEEVDLSAGTEKKRDKTTMMIAPFFFMLLMFMGVMTASQGLLNSVIEEKSSRVIEVLLSALSPFQLMSGKILGQTAVGLTLIAAYGSAAYGAALYKGIGDILTGEIAVYFALYYLPGFLLYASLFAAIGSTCNTVKESQSLMGPIMMFLMLPMFAWFYIVQHPQDTISIIMSYFPPMTPMIMILRIAVDPDLSFLEILGSLLLLLVSVLAVIWAAAKIFRTGILMYGKQPSPREILRWLR